MRFSKMHGAGNDFIVICDRKLFDMEDYSELTKKLCHRQLGIGADGLLVVLPSDKADIRMRIINSDGSEANMCGNGIRCFAKYVYDKNIVMKRKFTIETFAGIIEPEVNLKDGKAVSVNVNMGKPAFERKDIPMQGEGGRVVSEPISVDGVEYKITSMLMGVPHTMVFVDSLEKVDIAKVGPKIENHPLFPKRTNVNFIEVINRTELKVRTWERGAGLTMACGTGCCASVLAGFLNGKTDKKATVHLEAGDLIIDWKEDGLVFMDGPAVEVYEGRLSESMI